MKFSDWIKLKEEASAGAVAAPATTPATPSAPSSDVSDSVSTPSETVPSGTSKDDVAKVPMRLSGGCGFCFPHCNCYKNKRRKKKKKKGRKR